MQELTETKIKKIIKDDEWMMAILHTVKDLSLPDWWIGAGFIRSKVWDYLHGYTKRTPLPDIDVIYFDKSDLSEKTEEKIKNNLTKKTPSNNWQVKNQARMHLSHNENPYYSATEGLSRWIETATCIGVALDKKDEVILTAPLGISDLITGIVRPNPTIPFNKKLFEQRIFGKQWLHKWPKLRLLYT